MMRLMVIDGFGIGALGAGVMKGFQALAPMALNFIKSALVTKAE